MDKKAIVHIMTKSRMKSDVFTSDIDAIEEVSEKYWVKNVIFYKWEPIEYADLITKLEKFGIFVYNYQNKEDLKEQVLNFSQEYEVIFVTTAIELLINTVNEVKEALWRPMSENPDIFRNKFLQRELIQDHNPDLWIKFMKWTPEDLDIKEIEKHVGYPFIIKPVDWVQSSWVAKIRNKSDYNNYMKTYEDFHDRLKSRWVDNKDLIVEEFIDGTLYSLDYYVNDEWETTISKPVKVRLWIDVKVNDYCNIARISSEKTEWEFKWKRLKTFVNSTIKATWIKNTFVHHEFKINSKWELKTIELNGRLGWWRLELIKRAYDFNMYEMICNPDIKIWKLKESNIVVNIYASKRWMFRSYNEELLEKIEKRDSVYKIEKYEWYLGKEIWLTKDWFVKVWAIRMSNKDYSELAKDFRYIKNKYKELLIIDEFDENHQVRKKWVFSKIREYINR